MAIESNVGFRQMMVLINQAFSDLQMRTRGPISIPVEQGNVHDYFEEIRTIIELANDEVFFVDPYLDAEFVKRYLPLVKTSTAVRLLLGDDAQRIAKLLPAVALFAQQYKSSIEVRGTPSVHDRYIFVDKSRCFQSGTSFKDGPRRAHSLINQVVDAFEAVWNSYDSKWKNAKVER